MEDLVHLADAEQGFLLSWEQPNLPSDNNFWTHLDEDLTEQLLTDKMQKMSLREHEHVLFEVHSIARTDAECDPPGLDQRLQIMDANIHNNRRKQAYEQAKYLDEAHVQDRSLRLQCLRCDCFHTALAAQRLVSHFQLKKELFGDGPVLVRDTL